MIQAEAYAKVNFGLRVGRRREDGFHSVSGIFQSIQIVDRLTLEEAEEDSITTSDGRAVADEMGNLAFRAVDAVRSFAGSSRSLAVTLDKTIPAAAGLGGGSADAAAGLAMAGRLWGLDAAALAGLAPQLGSDVPFCLAGGTARISGRGEQVARLDPLAGFALGMVVPPLEIATPTAFRMWDGMGEPEGMRMAQSALPPALRDEGDLINDLYPASVRIVPQLDDWRADLERAWGRPVMLSGSGPALYGFFLDTDEAAGATDSTPSGARFAETCDLSPVGWRITGS